MVRVFAVAALCAAISISIFWPGDLPPDSLAQWKQASLGYVTDWHPPIMARLWQVMGLSIPAMLVLQFVLLWTGIALLADDRRRAGHRPWPVFLVGLVPFVAPDAGAVLKDHLLASAMLCAFGALRRFGMVGAILPAILATLTRANGVFAVAPLLTRRLPLALIVALALVPAVMVANHVLSHRQTGVIRSLFWFDIAGTDHFSREQSAISACYTPLMWDRLRTCTDERPGPERWLLTIGSKPLAYAEHRVRHFNLSTRMVVPDNLFCREWDDLEQCESRGADPGPLMWPALWLALGAAYLATRPDRFAGQLALSGTFYGLAYALIGVASEVRYYHWTTIAVLAAITYAPPRNWKILIGVAAVVWAVGTVARFTL